MPMMPLVKQSPPKGHNCPQTHPPTNPQKSTPNLLAGSPTSRTMKMQLTDLHERLCCQLKDYKFLSPMHFRRYIRPEHLENNLPHLPVNHHWRQYCNNRY